MVDSGKMSFNQEMGDYISSRRSRFKPVKKRRRVDLSAFLPSIKVSRVEDDQMQEMEQEIKEVDEAVHEAEIIEESLEEKREGLLQRFFKRMRRQEKPQEDEFEEMEQQNDVLDEEIRDVLRVTFKWIEQLPAYKLREFKNSDDFERYKEVLMKYNLVREKK